jgi:hypothetical protein
MKKTTKPYFGDFQCGHCKNYVSANMAISRVIHRNHCPYCLHSKHVDLHAAGDRLSACKSLMKPVGLTLKNSIKKYQNARQGELMLIHCCQECGKMSINRIAADDILQDIYEIYHRSFALDDQVRSRLKQEGIQLLQQADENIVRARLFGWGNKTLSETKQPVQQYLPLNERAF